MARDLIKDNPHPSAPSNGNAAEINQLRADLVALRAAYAILLAKLDLDGGVTDVNYAALATPAAMTSTGITINGAAPV
jgi:hypothetical protein